MVQGVEFNRLMLEMRSMQTEAMARQRSMSAATMGAEQVQAPSFAEMLGKAVNSVSNTQQSANDLAKAFELGQSGVDLTQVMISSQKASISMQALTQVRNKFVQAYQDISQMSI